MWICNVRFEKRAKEFIDVARLNLEAGAKASLKGRLVTWGIPEAVRSNHDQSEVLRKGNGGPN